jgi:hypothetical protein
MRFFTTHTHTHMHTEMTDLDEICYGGLDATQTSMLAWELKQSLPTHQAHTRLCLF